MMENNLLFIALVGGFVAAASAYLGSIMILKRMALVGDALTHVALPGMAIAISLSINPTVGAFIALTLAVLGIWYLEKSSDTYPEALVGVFFTASLALGVLLTDEVELLEALFGNIENSNSETRKESKDIGEKLPFLYNDLKKMKNVRIINNRIANFRGLRIGGLEYFIDVNWIREFKPEDYSKKLKSAKKQSEKAKKILKWFDEIDILVCHQPPYGILDKVGKIAPKHWQDKHAGSRVILDYIRKYQPKYVFCGHIHEGEGMKKIGRTKVYNLGFAGYKVIEL